MVSTYNRSNSCNKHCVHQMRYTGIPELTCVEDIEYLRDALMVTKDEFAAEMCFDKLLNKCIKLGWTVQISWWAHVIKTSNI